MGKLGGFAMAGRCFGYVRNIFFLLVGVWFVVGIFYAKPSTRDVENFLSQKPNYSDVNVLGHRLYPCSRLEPWQFSFTAKFLGTKIDGRVCGEFGGRLRVEIDNDGNRYLVIPQNP